MACQTGGPIACPMRPEVILCKQKSLKTIISYPKNDFPMAFNIYVFIIEKKSWKFLNCVSLAFFFPSKLIVRTAHHFEFDMPALEDHSVIDMTWLFLQFDKEGEMILISPTLAT